MKVRGKQPKRMKEKRQKRRKIKKALYYGAPIAAALIALLVYFILIN